MNKEFLIENKDYRKKELEKKKDYKKISNSFDTCIKSNLIMEHNRQERIKEYKNSW